MKPIRDPLDPLGLLDPRNPSTLRAIAENDQIGALIRDQRRGDRRRRHAKIAACVIAIGIFGMFGRWLDWFERTGKAPRYSGSTQYVISASDG